MVEERGGGGGAEEVGGSFEAATNADNLIAKALEHGTLVGLSPESWEMLFGGRGGGSSASPVPEYAASKFLGPFLRNCVHVIKSLFLVCMASLCYFPICDTHAHTRTHT